jgi:hypothetical protein
MSFPLLDNPDLLYYKTVEDTMAKEKLPLFLDKLDIFIRDTPLSYLSTHLADRRLRITRGLMVRSARPDPTFDHNRPPMMFYERIRSSPLWRPKRRDIGNKDPEEEEKVPGRPRFDTVLIGKRKKGMSSAAGLLKLGIARVKLIFTFTETPKEYPLLFVEWLKLDSTSLNLETGQFKFSKLLDQDGNMVTSVIPASTVISQAHLVPVFGKDIPENLERWEVFDHFDSFYLNDLVSAACYDMIQ